MIFTRKKYFLFHQQNGVVLIIVLMFIFSLSVLGFFTFERAILQYKMTQNFQQKVYNNYKIQSTMNKALHENDFWGLGRYDGNLLSVPELLRGSEEHLARSSDLLSDISAPEQSALNSSLTLHTQQAESHFFETQTLSVQLANSDKETNLEERFRIKAISRSTMKGQVNQSNVEDEEEFQTLPESEHNKDSLT